MSQMALVGTQSNLFGSRLGHNGWLDNLQDPQGRSALDHNLFFSEPIRDLSCSLTGTFDTDSTNPSADLSQVSCNMGNVYTQSAPPPPFDVESRFQGAQYQPSQSKLETEMVQK